MHWNFNLSGYASKFQSICPAIYWNFNQSASPCIEISINLPKQIYPFTAVKGLINRRRRYVSWFFPSFFLVSQVISMWYLIVPNEFVINAELPVYKSDVTDVMLQCALTTSYVDKNRSICSCLPLNPLANLFCDYANCNLYYCLLLTFFLFTNILIIEKSSACSLSLQ